MRSMVEGVRSFRDLSETGAAAASPSTAFRGPPPPTEEEKEGSTTPNVDPAYGARRQVWDWQNIRTQPATCRFPSAPSCILEL